MSNEVSVIDLTVDIGVFMIAFGLSDLIQSSKQCYQLTQKIESDPYYKLVYDSKGKIEYQYFEKLKNSFGVMWLKHLASKDKIKPVVPIRVDRGTKTALKEKHFDSSRGEDMKYVKTAAATECKFLVSYDPHYSAAVRRILKKRLSVDIYKAQDCLNLSPETK